MFGPTKAMILCYVMIYNIIQANQKDEYYVYLWLCAHPLLKVACFPTFVGASEVISSNLSRLNFVNWLLNVHMHV